MGAIKRTAIVLLVILAIGIIAYIVLVYGNDSRHENAVNRTDVALKIALQDPELQAILARNDTLDIPHIITISPIDNGSSRGFIRYNANRIGIAMQAEGQSGSPPIPYLFYYIVDPDGRTIADRSVRTPDWSGGTEVVYIPPGSAWYVKITGQVPGYGTPNLDIEANYTPLDARVRQIVVTRSGLDVLRNAPAQTPLQDVDISGYSFDYNGTLNSTMPTGTGWNVSVDWPGNINGGTLYPVPFARGHGAIEDHYLVIINENRYPFLGIRLTIMSGINTFAPT